MPDPKADVPSESVMRLLRAWLTPTSGNPPTIATNHGGMLEIPEVSSPYPFKNPATPTKEIDQALRHIRSVVPGAGTNVTEIQTSSPPGDLMKQAMRQVPGYAQSNNLNNLNLLGAMGVKGPEKGKLYLNPHENYAPDIESTMAHELTHAAGYDEADAAESAKTYTDYTADPQMQKLFAALSKVANRKK